MEIPNTKDRTMEPTTPPVPPHDQQITQFRPTPSSAPRQQNREFPVCAVDLRRDLNADLEEFKFLIRPHEKELFCAGIRILADALAFSSGFRSGWESCNQKQWLAKANYILSNPRLRAETGLGKVSLMWFMDFAFKGRLSDDMAQHMEVRKLSYILRALEKEYSAQYRVINRNFCNFHLDGCCRYFGMVLIF